SSSSHLSVDGDILVVAFGLIYWRRFGLRVTFLVRFRFARSSSVLPILSILSFTATVSHPRPNSPARVLSCYNGPCAASE
ncbi:hypothetical protein PENTCL1PPCAC_17018, partial [Pristionchus entomophagus]